MQFVIFHGSFGDKDRNWFSYLKRELTQLGQSVVLEQYPVDEWDTVSANGPEHHSSHQNLDNWMKTFEKVVLPQIGEDEPICFVGHSLAPLFILHILEKHKIQLDCAIFVAPFLSTLHRKWEIDNVNSTFYKEDFDFSTLGKLIPVSYVLYSNNDPAVPIEQPREFTRNLNSSPIIIKGGGHLNDKTGYSTFPLVLELCKTRIEK